jgi:hypothetical protein
MLETRLGSLQPEGLTLDDLRVLAQIARDASGIRTKRGGSEPEDIDALLERAKGNPELMAALGLK